MYPLYWTKPVKGVHIIVCILPTGLFYSIGRFEELSYGMKKALLGPPHNGSFHKALPVLFHSF